MIELNTGGKHVYTHLDNDRLSEGVHDALGRYHASGVVVDEDARLAREVLRGYASLRGETDVIRCKLYSLLLPAYKLLGEEDEFDRLHATMRGMLPVIKRGNPVPCCWSRCTAVRTAASTSAWRTRWLTRGWTSLLPRKVSLC